MSTKYLITYLSSFYQRIISKLPIFFFNITNSSGDQNATYTASNPSDNYWNATLNTSQFPDGIYNIKNRQRYNISPDDFELIVSEVPAVIGIKDTSYDVDQLLEYVERFGNKYFIAGAGDSMIYYTFSVGAHAHICGVSNAFPEVVVALYKAVVSGNHKEGQRYQFMINKLRRTLRKYSIELQEVFREVLKLRGIHSGYPPLQLSEGLAKDQLEELKKIVEPFIKMGAGISK